LATQLSLRIHEVVSRILKDPEYAAETKQAALAAVKGGSQSQAFKEYFERFASTPGELANLGMDSASGCPCKSNTYLTISSLVTPVPVCCNMTTTTTTSGDYFGVGKPGD
jgi:hypothetical protein